MVGLTNYSTHGIIYPIVDSLLNISGEIMAESFGTKLREYRRQADMSQRELARRIGRDFSYISKVENGRLPPPAADTVVKICEVLNIEPNELLALTGKLPSDVQSSVSTSERAQRFLREAQEFALSEEEWDSMIHSLRRLRE
jgi:transcriptional regulator with XRE-family HTH domain